jgi:hypothetical protein
MRTNFRNSMLRAIVFTTWALLHNINMLDSAYHRDFLSF